MKKPAWWKFWLEEELSTGGKGNTAPRNADLFVEWIEDFKNTGPGQGMDSLRAWRYYNTSTGRE